MKSYEYPEYIIRSAAKPRKERELEEKTPEYTICLSDVVGVSEDLRRVCRRYDIRTVFTTISTLRRKLSKVKDSDMMLSRAGVVYTLPCNCGKEYTGETKRALATHLKEHQVATR